MANDIAVTLPFEMQARAYKGSAPECVVMNTKTFAVSEYMNYGFNSMTLFNNEYLIADQNGIYKQDNSNFDNAGVDDYKIKAHIRTFQHNIDKNRTNRLRNAWLDYQTNGDIRIVVGADEKVTRYYSLPYHTALEGINERRIKFERGIRESTFDFKIQNINGSQMEIDKMVVTLEPIISKRR